MKPGPELDALIAEQVFKYPKPELVDGIYFINYETEDYNSVEPYSTDIAAAWKVINVILSKKFHVDIMVTPTSAENKTFYVCKIWKSAAGRYPTVEAEETQFPHAICLAALKAANSL